MKYKTFDTIYVNGCSHTAGGGLYDGGTKELYKDCLLYTSDAADE